MNACGTISIYPNFSERRMSKGLRSDSEKNIASYLGIVFRRSAKARS